LTQNESRYERSEIFLPVNNISLKRLSLGLKKIEMKLPIVTEQHFSIEWSLRCVEQIDTQAEPVAENAESGSCLVVMLIPGQILSPLRGIMSSQN